MCCSFRMIFSKLLLCLASLHVITASNNVNSMAQTYADDGEEFVQPRLVSKDDPSYAQGYFLKDAAEGPDNAKCLDGSPALYYHRKGTGTGVNKWILYQEGGGWCYTPENCVERSLQYLGSTVNDPDSMSIDGDNYFSMNTTLNPLMYNWNAIYIRYCDGSSLSSDMTEPVVVDNSTIHYRGRAILDAEIQSILVDRGMNLATDVVVSGCSAGGLATYLHCDKWAASIAAATGNAAKVVCMPISGFFVDYDYTSGDGYGTMMRYIYNFQNTSKAGLNEDCYNAHVATNDTEKCIMAQWSSQYIKTPTFPLQSQFDSWQHHVEARDPTDAVFNIYGQNMTRLIQSNLLNQKQHGVFLDSCASHCGNWASVIDGSMAGDALNLWYNKGSAGLDNLGFFFQNKTYPCPGCCNGSGD